MFISFDNGAHWQPFQLNLPQMPITDIKVHQKDLVVATQGRAFWILDNMSVAASAHAAGDDGRRHAVQAARRLSHAREPGDARPDDRVLPAVGAAGPGGDRDARREGRGREQLSTATRRPAGGRGRGGAAGAGGAPRRRRGGGAGRRRRPIPMRRRRRSAAAAPGVQTRVTKDAGMNRFVWDVQSRDGVDDAAGRVPGAADGGRRERRRSRSRC